MRLKRLSVTLTSPEGASQFTHDAAGRLTGITRANGAKSSYSYNAAGHLAEIHHQGPGSQSLAKFSYTHDANGRRTAATEDIAGQSRTVNWQYDADGKLVLESVSSAGVTSATSYQYDSVGNRVQKSQTRGGAAPVVTTYSYNRLDQLTAETTAGSTISYRYDGRGNLVEKKTPSQTVTYSWSSDNRLTQASNGSVTVKYGYDAQGRRISRTQEEGGQTEETQYLLDTARPYSEIVLERTRTNGGTWQQTMHVHTPDGVGLQLSQSSNGQAQNLYADAQGSTRLVTDHQGQTLQVLHFDAFGVEHDANPSSDIRHRYTGEAFDQTTGLYHLRARDYDPYTGRFISMDEHPGSQRIPLTLNKYLYGNADPVNTIDPSGYFGLGGVSISMGNMATLAMRALTLYDLFSSADEVGESLGLFGALLVSSVGGPAGFDAMTQDEVAIGVIMAFMPGPDKHHTIPIYMCGAKKQEYAHIDFSDHSSIHKKLYAGVLGINIVSKHYVDRYLKKPGKGGRQSTDPIVLLTKKKMGRDVLANFLRYFYQVNGYYGLTNKNNLSSHRSLGAVYEAEARKFTANNNTSHPSCKR